MSAVQAMSDEDIKKALEEFLNRILKTNLSYHIFESEMMAVVNALDLISRYQAEKERLQKELASKCLEYSLLEREKVEDILVFADDLKRAKSEAIKEFAEKLKSTYRIKERYCDNTKFVIETFRNSIDSLLAEMVGGMNEKNS